MRTLSVSEVGVVSGGLNEELTISGLVITVAGAIGATVAVCVLNAVAPTN